MEEAKEAIKKVIKLGLKILRRILLPILIGILPIIILLSAALYFLTVDDGTYKEGDWSSTPYGAAQYVNGVTVNSDGTFSSNMSAQELWDKMIENKSRVEEYLDGPEELARLMKAEIVTQYPDTRKNPDEEIDWENIIQNSDTMQGIIKFKRANSDGNTSTMSYVDPETFQGYIDEYNSSGSSTAKQNALTHFTLKKSATTSGGIMQTIDGINMQVIADKGVVSFYNGDGSSMEGGSNNALGWKLEDGQCALKGLREYAPYNSVIYIETSESGEGSYANGRFFYVTDTGGGLESNQVDIYAPVSQSEMNAAPYGKNESAKISLVEKDVTWEEYLEKYHNKTLDSSNTGDNKAKKTEQKAIATVTTVNGDGYTEEYTSSAGITYKHFKQFQGSYANNSYWDGTIHSSGCGPSSVSILASGLTNLNYTPADIASQMNSTYGYTGSGPLKGEMDSLGMASEIIENPSAEDITSNLQNGKVMLVSVNSNTIFTGNSHIMAIVDINSSGQVYICNPGSSTLYGWYDISELMKGCRYIVVTDAGATGVASSSNTSAYTAVVATWKQVDTTITTNDSNVQESSRTQYIMSTTNINYEEMVDSYTMPFDMLWALLVVGEDKNFVFELADLIYNSDIQVTVYDNLTVNTDIDEWHYTQRTKAVVNATITASCDGKTATGSIGNDIHDPHAEANYKTTKTVITQTNTVNIALTRANVWIVDYQNDYTYNAPTESSTSSTVNQDDEQYPEAPDSIGNSYSCEHINTKKQQLATSVSNSDGETSSVTFDETISVRYFNKYINIYDNITNKINTQKYIQGTPSLKEKTDRDSKEDNFVTIFNKYKYKKNKSNIKSASSWLFEIIEKNDSTKEMLDLMKYLLYKATDVKYGVLEYDFSEYDASLFSGVTGIYGGTIQEKVWFALRGLGYSEYATAGAMGNIHYESATFNPTKVEGGYNENNGGIGICQWTNNNRGPTGRNTNLKEYAKSKQTIWQDEDIQVEFLIAELTPGGGANNCASYELLNTTKYYGDSIACANGWINAQTIEDATKAFCYSFERPRKTDAASSMSERIKHAKDYYEEFKGREAPTTSGSSLEVANGTASQKLSYLFPNGTPTTAKEAERYMSTIDVAITNKNGAKTTGKLTIHKQLAGDVQEVFKTAQNNGFKIYQASGYSFRSMNNGGKGSLSHHSYGVAIDINVNENYSHRGNTIYAGSFWNPSISEYSIPRDGVLVKAFEAKGWKWGGNWSGNYQDYMHFSFTGN